MTDEDTKDLDGLIEGLTVFLNKHPGEVIRDEQLSPRDLLSTLFRGYDGKGIALCTASGRKHLHNLTLRRLSREKDGDTLDTEEVMRRFGRHFCKALKRGAKAGVSPDDVYMKVMSQAVKMERIARQTITYHFPCVLAGADELSTLVLGPVRFIKASQYLSNCDAASLKRLRSTTSLAKVGLDDYLAQYGWLASVKTPPCSLSVSRKRAEKAARFAINIVRSWLGLRYGRRLRLVHTEPATLTGYIFLRESEDVVTLSSATQAEGVRVGPEWLSSLPLDHVEAADYALMQTVKGHSSEVLERCVDAFDWYGDAAFETSPGAGLVKFANLLERVTCFEGESFSKRRFCKRVALLATSNFDGIEAAYWNAYKLYNARSAVVHGSKSQSCKDHWTVLGEVDELVSSVLIHALELTFLMSRRKLKVKDFRAYLDMRESRSSSTLQSLNAEMTALEKSANSKKRDKSV